MPTQNLVQIQNDLQSLPYGPQTMMYLKRAKDGMVASVPPYLAAAELASREKQAMRQKLSSGAAPGEMPTVSQQLSQKADLLALQAMKKKEMDAASMNQARTASGPAPEGAPEPEEQPQPEGGLASLPVDFQFADGGIVAFQDGGMPMTTGYAPDYQDARRFGIDLSPYDSPEERKAKLERLARMREAAKQMGQAQIPGQAPDVAALAAQMGKPPAPPAPPVRTASMTPQQIEAQVKQPPAAPPAAPQQGLPALLPQPAPAAPSTQQTLEAELMQRLGLGGAGAGAGAGQAAPTMGRTAEDIKAAQAAFGLDKAAGEEERQLIAEMRARHAQQQKDRARMGLKAVLGGFSQGYGGAAAADVAASQRAYAEDMAQQQEMYKLINAINKGNRGEAEKAFERTVGLQEKREQDVNALSRTELQTMASMYGNLLQAGSSRYNADAHVRVAILNAKKTDERANREDKKLAIDGLQSAERGVQQELTKLQGLMDRSSKERRAQLDEDLRAIRAQIARIAGVEMPARPSAPAAAPANRPPLTSFQR